MQKSHLVVPFNERVRGSTIDARFVNGEGVNKSEWVGFVIFQLNRGVVNSLGGQPEASKIKEISLCIKQKSKN